MHDTGSDAANVVPRGVEVRFHAAPLWGVGPGYDLPGAPAKKGARPRAITRS